MDKEMIELQANMKERKSFFNHENDGLSRKNKIILKWFNDLVVDFETDIDRMKFIENNLKRIKSNNENHRIDSPNLSNDKVYKIIVPGKNVIVLESDKEYLAYTLPKKDVKLKQPTILF